jgi:hypothetical protein
MTNIYQAEIHADAKTEMLLDEAWQLAQKLPENQEYLKQPWFTREYQLSLALSGSAASVHKHQLKDSWINECLLDHINDMKKLL